MSFCKATESLFLTLPSLYDLSTCLEMFSYRGATNSAWLTTQQG